jgi:drug/metabolite transporter (DMT)-like permease
MTQRHNLFWTRVVTYQRKSLLNPTFLALGAIALWATLASLSVTLAHVPPFLLAGLALLVGALPSLPYWRQWRVSWPTLGLGLYGLFGYHFLLFIALRHAPPVQANLVNYLWPLLIVVLAPLLLPGAHLKQVHILAAIMGFAGAALAITGGRALPAQFAWGYLPALASAFIWASYSLLTKRVAPFPTAAIGLFAAVSGLLSLACHALLEPAATLAVRDCALIAVMGLGPLGAAFYLWDAALKKGDAAHIGLLSFLTPLLSTLLLLLVRGEPPSLSILLAAALIVGAALLGRR